MSLILHLYGEEEHFSLAETRGNHSSYAIGTLIHSASVMESAALIILNITKSHLEVVRPWGAENM